MSGSLQPPKQTRMRRTQATAGIVPVRTPVEGELLCDGAVLLAVAAVHSLVVLERLLARELAKAVLREEDDEAKRVTQQQCMQRRALTVLPGACTCRRCSRHHTTCERNGSSLEKRPCGRTGITCWTRRASHTAMRSCCCSRSCCHTNTTSRRCRRRRARRPIWTWGWAG